MDPESLQKWKDEFQNERKKQFSKVRGLQKETTLRRKAMEMKAQIEAAKEEKRRKEALADRKAQHMEATMRYQKGIKNFKIQKEKISLEEVLKQINAPRSRLNSADSESRTKLHHNDLANYYCVNKKYSMTRRSSSVDSLNRLIANDFNSTPKTNTSSYRTNTFNIEQYNSSTTPNRNNFKHVINENQKQIHEMNREALREFQNLIKNELGSRPSSQTSSFIYPINQKFTNLLPQTEIKREPETYSEVGTIITVDDDDERDSIDTDSLLNARIESPDFSKPMLDKKIGNDDVVIPISRDDNSFNTYFRIGSSDSLKKGYFQKPEPVKNEMNLTAPVLPPQAPKLNNAKKSKQIKSILKRSSSLDSNSLLISGLNKTAFNFKVEKVVKDSIELANNRLNTSDSESGRKKSVRFAAFEEDLLQMKANENLIKNESKSEPVQNTVQQIPTMTSQINQNNVSSSNYNNNEPNEPGTRISSTNSIRRPIIKPRNTSHLKQKTPIETPKQNENNNFESKPTLIINENSKPPLPIGQNGYSTLSQKRKEFYQRNKLLGDKQTLSPKLTQSKPLLSPSTSSNPIEPVSNFMYNHTPEEQKQVPQNDRIFRQVIQNFQENRSKNTPPSTAVQPSQTQINFKLNENRETQINRYKNELNKELNYTEPLNNIENDQYMTRINLNNIPQQYVQKAFFNVQDFKQQQQQPSVSDQIKRPFSSTTPNSKMLQDNANIRLAYLNSVQQSKSIGFNNNNVPRVLSADSINRNQSQTIQLEIKYPFYSNIQTQPPNTAFLNISKPIKPVPSQDPPHSAKEVLDSMALFLKAEDMSGKNYSESQILNTVQDYKNGAKQGMTSLSLEEQRIKNSLMRLDERYNMLKTQNNGRFNQDDLNGKKINVMSRYQRPVSTNLIRFRK